MRPCSSLLLAIATLLPGTWASAQPKDKPTKPPAATVDLKPIQEKLKSADPQTVAQGLVDAKAAGAAGAPLAPSIEEILKKGATPPVDKAAIEALGAMATPSSSSVLRPYIRHRTPDVRRAAVRALGNTKGPEAIAAFKEGLRTEDGQVRGFSATGLGNLGAADAIPDLFLALDRSVTEAAAAIGQLCAPDDCEKFAGRLGRIGFDVMTSGFDPILFRQKPLPEEALIKIVGRLRELGTPEVSKYLTDVQSRWPANGSKKVKQAIDSAIPSIPGGAK